MSAATATGRWLVRRKPRPEARIDLYCFPHAGGSPGEYVRWADHLPDVQVWGVQYPGRGSNARTPPQTRMEPLVEYIVDGVAFTRPFVLFGHSLGGLVAFEVARALRERDRALPERLVVSATPPPPLPRRSEFVHTLPDDELIDLVGRRWGGLPAAVLADPALRASVIAQHRADLAVFETYEYRPDPRLPCPISAFVGDGEADTLGMDGWRLHTDGDFDLCVLPGGHFYLRDSRDEFLGGFGSLFQ